MPKLTKEEKKNFSEKLKYIGLDIEKIPAFLKDFKPLDYRTSKRFDNKEYLVYRYVPISSIQIMITKANRLTDIKEKYELAKPISEFLEPKSEEDIENFAVFLNMLKNTEISEIMEIEESQKKLNKEIPYKVRYEKNYLWQIYYSDYSDQYFMMVPSEEGEYGSFFYLLKEQIKKGKGYIYTPIANYEPGEDILKKSERTDLENYLWLITKNWPMIYEVTGKDKDVKIIVTGEMEIYPSIKTQYHVELKDRNAGTEFYKKLKALFIMQTELPEYYFFIPQIDEDGVLKFYYNNKEINYADLSEFIKDEYIQTEKNINKLKKEKTEASLKLEELKVEETIREREFLEKQREISTYLQYKKTFLGKVKYFFSRKKKNKKNEISVEETVLPSEDNEEGLDTKKDTYTIEDLVTIYGKYSKIFDEIKNDKMDIKALELKIKNFTKKIENANLFIEEIDKHKKSIFEFWRFSSKDDLTALNEGEETEQSDDEKKLRKVFELEEDKEEVTKQIDRKQRESLSKEECDSIFAVNSKILPVINKIKEIIKINDEQIEELLDELKKEEKQQNINDSYEHDIFGGMSEDRTKIKILGKNKHRENEKNLFQILGISKNTNIKEFKEKLINAQQKLENCFGRTANVIDMPIYKIVPKSEKIDLYGYNIYSIDVQEELKNANIVENECNLFKVNLQEEMPAIFYTNIMYFDNFNKTLPLGMDKSNSVIINSSNFSFTLKSKKVIYTNGYFSDDEYCSNLTTKKINVFEYDIELKEKERKK